jgi:hypothetical protein
MYYDKDTDHPSGAVYISPGQLVTIRVAAGTAYVLMKDGSPQIVEEHGTLTSRDILQVEPRYPGFARFSVEYH